MVTLAESRSFLEARHRLRCEQSHALWEQAQTDAQRMIGHLAQVHNPSRIWQWGSVLHPVHFSAMSDIDLAVEGVHKPEQFFQMLGELMEMSRFPVDLVQLEKIEPEFATLIRSKGRVVYERTD